MRSSYHGRMYVYRHPVAYLATLAQLAQQQGAAPVELLPDVLDVCAYRLYFGQVILQARLKLNFGVRLAVRE